VCDNAQNFYLRLIVTANETEN